MNAHNQRRWTWYPEQAEAFGANLPNENPTNLINGTPTQLGGFSYHLRFPGQLFNPATGLSYNYFRDYNPRTGRFPESDPIGLAGGQVSTYTYVNGNPVWWTDEEGLSRFDAFYNLPKEFWHWAHRNGGMELSDLPEAEAKELAKEWERLGKPRPDNKRKYRQKGYMDSSMCEILIPWWLIPAETGECNFNGKCSDELW